MEEKCVLLEKSGQTAIITINRPHALNALSKQVVAELRGVLDDLEVDDNILCVIVRGAGDKAFVAGTDVKEMNAMTIESGRTFTQGMDQQFCRLQEMEKFTIAAVNGFALGGGCELAMSCDMRVASTKAVFGQPEVGLGVIPGSGGTQRMARLIGVPLTKYYVLTCDSIKADRALEIGLVEMVVEPEALMDTCLKIAAKVTKQPNMAVRVALTAIEQGRQFPLRAALALESEGFQVAFQTEDRAEGMTAFAEKRKPRYKSKEN